MNDMDQKDDGSKFGFTTADGLSFTPSQCANCKFNTGFATCLIFGKKPDEYASVVSGVKCPRREEK